MTIHRNLTIAALALVVSAASASSVSAAAPPQGKQLERVGKGCKAPKVLVKRNGRLKCQTKRSQPARTYSLTLEEAIRRQASQPDMSQPLYIGDRWLSAGCNSIYSNGWWHYCMEHLVRGTSGHVVQYRTSWWYWTGAAWQFWGTQFH